MSKVSKLVFVFFSLGAGLPAFASESCRLITAPKKIDRLWKDTHNLNWANDLVLSSELKWLSAAAGMKTFVDPQFRTRFYFSGGGDANLLGEIPIVDPKAKALYIFIHGVGTMNGSGEKFVAQFAELYRLGFAGLSFDLPFHADGPRENRLANANYFMEWLHGIVNKYRIPGQPVILVGHSFGPEAVFEYRYRYGDVEVGMSGLGVSPAGFNRALQKWYNQKTSKMRFGGDVQTNTAGSFWAGQVTQGFMWNKGPAKTFPNFPLTVASGNWEEYVPAPVGGKNKTPIGPNTYDMRSAILKLIPDAKVVIEKGVGHYIFGFRDGNGDNVILREMLNLMGFKPSDMVQLAKVAHPNTSLTQTLLTKYAVDPVFRAWADISYNNNFLRMMKAGNEDIARKVLDLSQIQLEARLRLILEDIRATKETDPEFYQMYSKIIESGKDLTTIIFPYVDLLEQKRAFKNGFAVADRRSEEIQFILNLRPQQGQKNE